MTLAVERDVKQQINLVMVSVLRKHDKTISKWHDPEYKFLNPGLCIHFMAQLLMTMS